VKPRYMDELRRPDLLSNVPVITLGTTYLSAPRRWRILKRTGHILFPIFLIVVRNFHIVNDLHSTSPRSTYRTTQQTNPPERNGRAGTITH